MRGLSAAALCAAAALQAAAVEIDGVAAKVGSETILRSDVAAEMARAGMADPSRYEEVRNEMIDRKLILKAAADAKMTMQEWLIENRIREIVAKAFGGDRNKLMEELAKRKMSYPEWRSRMKEDMVVTAMRWNVVGKNVTASPAEMRMAYERHPEKYAVAAKASVDVISLPPEEKDRRGEISAKVRDMDFVALGAKTYTDVNPSDTFAPELCKEIAALPKGAIGRWIEIDGWSFLVRKNGETPSSTRTFEEAYDDIAADVKEEASRKAYRAWLERLRAETYIKVY